MELFKKIVGQGIFAFLLLTFSAFTFAQHEGHNHAENQVHKQETNESIVEAKRLELLDWPVHKGKPNHVYRKRYSLIINLDQTHINMSESTKIKRGEGKEPLLFMSSDQLDQLYPYIAERIIGGTDFSILTSSLLDGNQLQVHIGLPQGVESVNFKTDELLLGAGIARQGRFGLPNQKYGIAEYAKSDAWDKESGIEALRVRFNSGETAVGATLFFKSVEGFQKTFAILRDVPSTSRRPYKLESGKYAYAMYLVPENIPQLEDSQHLVNIIPNPHSN